MAFAVSGASGQAPWISSQRNGDEVRFLFGNQIQRYDLVTKSWLPAVTLPRTGATAMAADAQGTAVAYGSSIYRYGTDFTGEALLGSTSSNIESLFFDGNLLIAVHSAGLYSRVKILNRTSGAQLSFVETYVDSLYGTSHAPQTNRLYGRTQGISPADIVTASYTDAGVVGNTAGSPYHGNYPTATRSWVFPNESRVVDSSGTVYTAPGLNYFGSFAGTITDIAFNGDVPVLLRGGNLIAYTPNLLETGRSTVGVTTGAELQVTASEAFVFSPGFTHPSVSVVALSALSAQEPGPPVNPDGLAYTVDDAFQDKDGNLLLFSKGQQSLFRWSPSTRQYTGSIPLAGVPKYAAYSSENHSAYFAYETQEIRKIDLSADKPKEVPFVNLPTPPNGLATAGEFVFASDYSGGWKSHYVYSPAGALLHWLDYNGYSRVWEWDATKRRMYFFEDDFSPNDLRYETIDAAGKITGEGGIPYYGDFTGTPPIRISPDGTRVVIGSGVAFNTDGLTKTANLANGFSDAVWSGGKFFTLRLINGLSQLQVWVGDQFLPDATIRHFSGTPVRLFNTSAGLCVVTSIEGSSRLTLLNAALETVYVSPSRPVAPAAPSVVTRSENSISLAWRDMSDNEDSFRVEYHTGNGAWVTGTTTGSGVTNAVVSGLAAGTLHAFRVLAVNGALVSTPSLGVSGKTLSSANEPVGEPYKLIASRIYNDRITLEWLDNASNETTFRIYRSTSSASLGTQLQVPANTGSYTDTGLTASTTYYYRVQAVNGAFAGDLSAQVSGRTLSSAFYPSAPSSFTEISSSPTAAALSWKDNSTDEDGFIIERAEYASTTWIEIARVDYNVRSHVDSTVQPDTLYNYRVRAWNSNGASSNATATLATRKVGGNFAGHSVRAGDIHYFAFSEPHRIERYDLATRQWLAPVMLQAAATALWVDESGIFVAEDRAVARFALDGTTRSPIGNGEATVRTLFTLKEVLVFSANSQNLITMDKRSGIFLSNISYWYSGAGYSVAPGLNRVFFRSTGVSPSDIHYLEIGPDGKLIVGRDSPYHGDYASATRTFLFPNGARVADDSGTVYSTDSLTYTNSLGTAFTDLDFHGPDIPIVLRSNKLTSYTNTLLESGSFTLSANGLRLAVSGTDALVFIADGTTSNGLRVQTVPLSQLAAPVPGQPIDPRGLAFTPDDVFVDKDGNVLLFSKAHLSLFRWSPQMREYLHSLPLLGSPKYAAYSRGNHCAYFAYETQEIRKMDLSADKPKEVPLVNLPTPPNGLATAGEFVFASDASGAWGTHYVYSPAGALLHSLDWNYYSRVWEWDATKRRMYFFRDGTSPNDLHYETVDTTGKITGEGETPYHGDFTVTPPIRISPDSTKMVIGSGVVFETAGMTKLATLPNTFTDAIWRTNELLTIRSSGGGTQIQRWNSSSFAAGASVPAFTGTPLRLLALNASESALITLVGGVPRIYLLNEDLSVAFTYESVSPIVPPIAVEDMPYSWKPTVPWQKLGTGPLTITAPVLPAWLKFENGILSGTPRDPDSGDPVSKSKNHRLVLRAVNEQNISEEKELSISVIWRNDAPTFSPNPMIVTANPKADDTHLDLKTVLSDPDAMDSHVWQITSVSNPSIFSNLLLGANGLLDISYTPYISGSSVIMVDVTDLSGASARIELDVTLPVLPPPGITINPTIRFNRANGLYEQKVTVKNIAARAIAGFDLTVSGLRSGVSLYNGTSKNKGGGGISYHNPIAAGQSVAVILKYYASRRGTIPTPKIGVSLYIPTSASKSFTAVIAPKSTATANIAASMTLDSHIKPANSVAIQGNSQQAATPAAPFAISSIVRGTDGSVIIGFPSEAGKNYRIQYSTDCVRWNDCPETIPGNGAKANWIDSGPPSTESPPASAPRRFYRVQRLDP